MIFKCNGKEGFEPTTFLFNPDSVSHNSKFELPSEGGEGYEPTTFSVLIRFDLMPQYHI